MFIELYGSRLLANWGGIATLADGTNPCEDLPLMEGAKSKLYELCS